MSDREQYTIVLSSISMAQESKGPNRNPWEENAKHYPSMKFDFRINPNRDGVNSSNVPQSGIPGYPPRGDSIPSIQILGDIGGSRIHADGLSHSLSPSNARLSPAPETSYIRTATYYSSLPESHSAIHGGGVELSGNNSVHEPFQSHNYEEMEDFLRNMDSSCLLSPVHSQSTGIHANTMRDNRHSSYSSNLGSPMNPGQLGSFPDAGHPQFATRRQQASSSYYIKPFEAYKRLLQKPPLPTDELDGLFPPDQKAQPTGGDGYICKLKAYIPRHGPAEWITLECGPCNQHLKSKDSYRRHVILCHLGCHRQDGIPQDDWIERRFTEAKAYQT